MALKVTRATPMLRMAVYHHYRSPESLRRPGSSVPRTNLRLVGIVGREGREMAMMLTLTVRVTALGIGYSRGYSNGYLPLVSGGGSPLLPRSLSSFAVLPFRTICLVKNQTICLRQCASSKPISAAYTEPSTAILQRMWTTLIFDDR